MNLTDKQKGISLSLIGVLLITPDSLFIRLINHSYTVHLSVIGIKKGTRPSSFFSTIDFHYI